MKEFPKNYSKDEQEKILDSINQGISKMQREGLDELKIKWR